MRRSQIHFISEGDGGGGVTEVVGNVAFLTESQSACSDPGPGFRLLNSACYIIVHVKDKRSLISLVVPIKMSC